VLRVHGSTDSLSTDREIGIQSVYTDRIMGMKGEVNITNITGMDKGYIYAGLFFLEKNVPELLNIIDSRYCGGGGLT
jgi:hypothetical protein